MSSNEPDIGTKLAAMGAGASSSQSSAGNAGMSLDQMSFADGFAKRTKGLDNTVGQGIGGQNIAETLNGRLVDGLLGKNPSEVFRGIQTLNCAPPPSAVMTAPNIAGYGSIVGINQGQG